eukprot:36714-Hanusia_phi.AAC.2
MTDKQLRNMCRMIRQETSRGPTTPAVVCVVFVLLCCCSNQHPIWQKNARGPEVKQCPGQQ